MTSNEDVVRALVELRTEIAQLRAEVRAGFADLRALILSLAESRNGERVAPHDPIVFRKALRAAVAEIDRRDRHDGLVPIGKLRRTLAYLGLNRATFDAALLEEERAYIVDLKVANDPTRVKDPDEGIVIEGRGLLYFVVRR